MVVALEHARILAMELKIHTVILVKHIMGTPTGAATTMTKISTHVRCAALVVVEMSRKKKLFLTRSILSQMKTILFHLLQLQMKMTLSQILLQLQMKMTPSQMKTIPYHLLQLQMKMKLPQEHVRILTMVPEIHTMTLVNCTMETRTGVDYMMTTISTLVRCVVLVEVVPLPVMTKKMLSHLLQLQMKTRLSQMKMIVYPNPLQLQMKMTQPQMHARTLLMVPQIHGAILVNYMLQTLVGVDLTTTMISILTRCVVLVAVVIPAEMMTKKILFLQLQMKTTLFHLLQLQMKKTILQMKKTPLQMNKMSFHLPLLQMKPMMN